ncbi:hypothetical protein RFI_06588 [Reticulomyxa filosa]|uniref:Uncharacterized protein n=1 Tax=Reticulomyxa filosa TaxID=46433 RepID=X6NZ29_RETFI|nr:hypothetical protein RFI_06588 [Reticulomyxa filosa]|eukprot:ETO30532.1 hypothetical protein RFI_06588 [Reticulomyxa filosa]
MSSKLSLDDEIALLTTTDKSSGYVEPEKTTEKKLEQVQNENNNEDRLEALDFKKHWNRNWRKANVEAAKVVKQMMNDNEQGMIIIAYRTSEWREDVSSSSPSSFIQLIRNDNVIKKQYRNYWMYVIKGKLITLENVTIDGNVYIVNCELKSKENTAITTQMIITKNAMIDKKWKECVSVIEWDMKAHYEIPLKLDDFEKKDEEYASKKLLNESLNYLQKYLKFCIKNFGLNHPYIAISYNMIGLTYNDKEEYNDAIKYFEKALQILLNIFGINYPFVSQLYFNLANTYSDKSEYDASILYYQKSLTIRFNIFGNIHEDIANSYYGLGCVYEIKGENDQAIQFFEKTLQIRLLIFDVHHNDVAKTYFSLGNVYQSSNQLDKAIQFYEKSLDIRLHILDFNHKDIADTYYNLGCSYDDNKQYDQAIQSHQNSLKIRKHLFGNFNEGITDPCWNLGCIYEVIGDKKTASTFFEESWKWNLYDNQIILWFVCQFSNLIYTNESSYFGSD